MVNETDMMSQIVLNNFECLCPSVRNLSVHILSVHIYLLVQNCPLVHNSSSVYDCLLVQNLDEKIGFLDSVDAEQEVEASARNPKT